LVGVVRDEQDCSSLLLELHRMRSMHLA
jgi:hypothetical protein